MRRKNWPPRRGGTLVELLVVVGLLGVVASLVLPAIQRARASASRAGCQNALRQIGIAVSSFHSSHDELPPGRAMSASPASPGVVLSLFVHILPEMGRDALYQSALSACQLPGDAWNVPPHGGFKTGVPDYDCPADDKRGSLTDAWGVTAAYTSYVASGGAYVPAINRVLPGSLSAPAVSFRDITDGCSNTLMIGERPPPDDLRSGWWYPGFNAIHLSGVLRGPNNFLVFGTSSLPLASYDCAPVVGYFGYGVPANTCDRYHFWSLHPGGGNWLFADGSVRFLSYSADPVMGALATRAGDEAVSPPD